MLDRIRSHVETPESRTQVYMCNYGELEPVEAGDLSMEAET